MSSTDGWRIYAIGDVHGCLDALNTCIGHILDDLLNRPHAEPLLLFVGDYTDRGPDSRGVLDRLVSLSQETWIQPVFLFGNHDKLFLDFVDNPNLQGTEYYHWLDPELGGAETLASYGIENARPESADDAHRALLSALPEAHRAFLSSAHYYAAIGSYLFVHAGIMPGIRVEGQSLNDLIWIREPFLLSTEDHGAVVVHGHTVVGQIEDHGNRIAIDTGAVFGGTLSCLVLEDDDRALLTEEGLAPVPKGRSQGRPRRVSRKRMV
ncbi:MAG: metallophosphoesterase [Pseudomonadota bacterium]